jgi:hypothetical protein
MILGQPPPWIFLSFAIARPISLFSRFVML